MPAITVPPGVEGIAAITELPDESWQDRWTRIIVPSTLKDRLLNYLLFSLRHRASLSTVGLPMHGLVILSGPPGTGKTTLAGGLADQAARALGAPLIFVDIDPHVFPSQLLGESQRSVARLFERTLPDLARRGHPMVVLLDEVEALAPSRSRASLETNPVDVHRATDAVLAGVDRVARAWPNVTFLATTNYELGVDGAFLSRADLIEDVGLPSAAAIRTILADTLREVTGTDPGASSELDDLAAGCTERAMDARQVRKLILRTIASDRALAMEPSGVTAARVLAVLRATATEDAPG